MNVRCHSKWMAFLSLGALIVIIVCPTQAIAKIIDKMTFKLAHTQYKTVALSWVGCKSVIISVPPADNALDASVVVQLERWVHGQFQGDLRVERIGNPWVVKKGNPLRITDIPQDGDIRVRITNRDCWLEVGVYMVLDDS